MSLTKVNISVETSVYSVVKFIIFCTEEVQFGTVILFSLRCNQSHGKGHYQKAQKDLYTAYPLGVCRALMKDPHRFASEKVITCQTCGIFALTCPKCLEGRHSLEVHTETEGCRLAPKDSNAMYTLF